MFYFENVRTFKPKMIFLLFKPQIPARVVMPDCNFILSNNNPDVNTNTLSNSKPKNWFGIGTSNYYVSLYCKRLSIYFYILSLNSLGPIMSAILKR